MLRNNYFYRDCYVTNDSINYKRSEFMKVLNRSYRKGCLQCSMVDRELNEFLQFKRRKMIITKKNAGELIGKRKNGCWILGNGVYISPTGMEISSSEYVWISHIFEGHGVPKLESACSITLPLSTVRLKPFIEILSETLKHNFIPGLLTLGSTALILNYQLIIEKLRYCPIPLAFVPSGTGKTTALECGMSLIEAQVQGYHLLLMIHIRKVTLVNCSLTCIMERRVDQ